MNSKTNAELLPPLTTDEFIPSISPLITSGGMFLAIAFGVAAALATVLQYNVTVKASANIRPLGELRLAQSAIGGVVRSIKIRENQRIAQGEPIIYLDDSQLLTQKKQLQGNIRQSRLQLAQITAQSSSLNLQLQAETQLIERSIASARAELRLQTRNYQDKRATVLAEVEQAQASLSLARDEMQRYQELANSGAIALLQVKQKQQAFRVAQIQLKQAQTSLNPSNAEIAIANEKIASQQAQGLSTLANLRKEQENLRSQKVEIENKLASDIKSWQQIELELGKTVIRSPIDGTVLTLTLRNPGQMVQSGAEIAQIAPGNAAFVVKANVAGNDIDKVKLGQRVQMRISACPYTDYGTLEGKVNGVAADAVAVTNKETQAGGTSLFYEVTILPQNKFLSKGNRICHLKAGMEGKAEIISRRETVLEFILRKSKIMTEP